MHDRFDRLDGKRHPGCRHRLEPVGEKKTRDKYLAELAAFDRDHREKLLTRLRPELQAEVRQQLMQRYGLS